MIHLGGDDPLSRHTQITFMRQYRMRGAPSLVWRLGLVRREKVKYVRGASGQIERVIFSFLRGSLGMSYSMYSALELCTGKFMLAQSPSGSLCCLPQLAFEASFEGRPIDDESPQEAIEALGPAPPAIMRHFASAHLPPRLRDVSGPFGELAAEMVRRLPCCAERSAGLRKLLEAKDCMVRARLEGSDE